jgi:hypothetical protein
MRKQILSTCALAIFLMSMPNAYAACPCGAGYDTVEKTSTFSWNIFKGFKKCEPCTKTKCVKQKCPKQAKDKCNKCAKEPKCPKKPKCTGAAAPAPAPCNECTKAF